MNKLLFFAALLVLPLSGESSESCDYYTIDLLRHVVHIRTETGGGTGIVLNSTHLATAWHVVDEAEHFDYQGFAMPQRKPLDQSNRIAVSTDQDAVQYHINEPTL